MRQNAVFQLCFQCLRKTRNFFRMVMNHFRTDGDMTEELPVISIFIQREIRKFLRFSDIMKHGRRNQKITVNRRIFPGQIIAELCNGKRMLQKSSDETVMHALCRRMLAERFRKFLISEKAVEQLMQIGILYAVLQDHEFLEHGLGIFLGDRKIIRRDVFAFIRLAHLLQGSLQAAVERIHDSRNIDIIKDFEFSDSFRRRIPDFCIQISRPVLENDIFIILAVFRNGRLLVLAEIDILNTAAFPQFIDILHENPFFLKCLRNPGCSAKTLSGCSAGTLSAVLPGFFPGRNGRIYFCPIVTVK